MFKKLIGGFLVLLLTLSLTPVTALTQGADARVPSGVSITRAEETMWYFRVYNGRNQKRLWSITRGIWLTEWAYY